MIKIYIDFDGKMPYILVFGYSKAQMQKHHSIFIFVGIFFFLAVSQFSFLRMDLYTFGYNVNGVVHFCR